MTVTVQVWKGPQSISYDDLLGLEPDEYELPTVDPLIPEAVVDDDRVLLEDSIEDHSTYAFQVPNEERPVTVNVYTCDSYHNREDWSGPIERGLTFHTPDDREPFQTEMWGRVMMFAEVTGDAS